MNSQLNFKKLLFLVFTIIGLVILWKLQFIIILIIIAFMLTVILRPFVKYLRKRHIPALFAIVIPLLVVSSIIVGIAFYVRIIVVEQLPLLISTLSSNIDFFDVNLLDPSYIERLLESAFDDYVGLAITVGISLIQVVFGFLTVVVLVAYWLGDYEKINDTLISYIPKKHHKQLNDIIKRIEHKLGTWFVGQVIVSVVVGVATWLVASLIGLPYAGLLGLLAGLLEIFPTFGPILAALPAIALGAIDSLEKAVIVTIAYIIIQQLESHLLSPMILSKTIRLHPIVIIISFLSGGLLFGLIGALFAVPVALMASSIVDSFREYPKEFSA